MGLTTAAGFDSTAYNIEFTGDTNEFGAPWAILDNFIDQPDEATFIYGISTDADEIRENISSLGLVRDISSSIDIFGEGGRYIRDWLIDSPDAPVNSVMVRVTDILCPKFLGLYQVETEQLRWCEDEPCNLTLSLEEYTPKLNCLQNTFIYDNHQGWFPPDGLIQNPLPKFFHPRYRYCDDIKPQFLQNFLFIIANSLAAALNTLTGAIIAIASAIQDLINAVFGSGTVTFADGLQDGIEQAFGDIFEALLGCNRLYPAPFLRTYFQNACDKCGLTFQSNILNGDTVNGKIFNEYYNTSFLFAPEDKGVKENSDYDWIHNNRPNLHVPELAFMLKDVFNAKYGIDGDTFYFNRKDTFPTQILFDFTGSDRNYIIDSICYNTNTRDKRFAATSFKYAQDAQDMSGNDARHRYNGVKVWSSDNVRFKGTKKIEITDISVARFTTDGIQQKKAFKNLADQPYFNDSTLLLEKDALGLAKLLIWNGISDYEDAEVIKIDLLDMYYPFQWGNADWAVDHYNAIVYGEYYVFNHPLYFDPLNGLETGSNIPYFNLANMHVIDNPTSNGVRNEFWTVKLELCCDVLDRVLENSADGVIAHIDYLCQLRTGVVGSIENVQIVYGDDEQKNYIQLDGVVSYQL